MNDADGSPNEAWVTVFGFPPGSLAAVLEAFQRDGDVVTHDSFASSAPANASGGANENESGPNWVHVRFATGAGAARALRRNGTKVSGVMVGVRRLDDDARAVVEREHGGAGLLARASGSARRRRRARARREEDRAARRRDERAGRETLAVPAVQGGRGAAAPAERVEQHRGDRLWAVTGRLTDDDPFFTLRTSDYHNNKYLET